MPFRKLYNFSIFCTFVDAVEVAALISKRFLHWSYLHYLGAAAQLGILPGLQLLLALTKSFKKRYPKIEAFKWVFDLTSI